MWREICVIHLREIKRGMIKILRKREAEKKFMHW
jgi:hypothetical protein